MKKKNEQPRIIVTVSGGVVQNVEGVPPGVVVEVRDYDVMGCDEEDLIKDENGELYEKGEW